MILNVPRLDKTPDPVTLPKNNQDKWTRKERTRHTVEPQKRSARQPNKRTFRDSRERSASISHKESCSNHHDSASEPHLSLRLLTSVSPSEPGEKSLVMPTMTDSVKSHQDSKFIFLMLALLTEQKGRCRIFCVSQSPVLCLCVCSCS